MWDLRYERQAADAFRKLDRGVQTRIKTYMASVCRLEDPTVRGKALTGEFSGHWRYRVGDYRLICRIVRGELFVSVVELGHRSSVYD